MIVDFNDTLWRMDVAWLWLLVHFLESLWKNLGSYSANRNILSLAIFGCDGELWWSQPDGQEIRINFGMNAPCCSMCYWTGVTARLLFNRTNNTVCVRFLTRFLLSLILRQEREIILIVSFGILGFSGISALIITDKGVSTNWPALHLCMCAP